MKTLNDLTEKIFKQHYQMVNQKFKNDDIYNLLDNYIKNKYSDIFSQIGAPDEKSFILEEWYKSEDRVMKNLSIDQKYGLVKVDNALLEIIDNSREILRVAMEKKQAIKITQKTISRMEKTLQTIKENINKVLDVNKEIAMQELSEAQVEYNFIKDISPNYSIRMVKQFPKDK